MLHDVIYDNTLGCGVHFIISTNFRLQRPNYDKRKSRDVVHMEMLFDRDWWAMCIDGRISA